MYYIRQQYPTVGDRLINQQIEKFKLIPAPAIRNRGNTGETHLSGFENIDFWVVCVGGETSPLGGFPAPWELANPEGLGLCSSELYLPKTFKTSSKK
ncbi:MAG TPA: hypothetical protein V6D25_03735 [Leptolyngbyaceae cyanobacterium]